MRRIQLHALAYFTNHCVLWLQEWVSVLEDEEDDDDDDDDDNDDSDEEDDESLGDWANLETMRNCHPMFFAKRMTEVLLKSHVLKLCI